MLDSHASLAQFFVTISMKPAHRFWIWLPIVSPLTSDEILIFSLDQWDLGISTSCSPYQYGIERICPDFKGAFYKLPCVYIYPLETICKCIFLLNSIPPNTWSRGVKENKGSCLKLCFLDLAYLPISSRFLAPNFKSVRDHCLLKSHLSIRIHLHHMQALSWFVAPNPQSQAKNFQSPPRKYLIVYVLSFTVIFAVMSSHCWDERDSPLNFHNSQVS